MITERSRIESRKWRAELAAIEAAEKERIERPIREAEAKLQETHRQLRAVEAERVTKMRDENVFMGELAGARMTQDEAAANNKKAVDQFLLECFEYEKYRTDATRDTMLSYLDRNGVNLWSVAILRAAFTKLRDLRLLTEKPPAPEPEQPVHDKEFPVNETPKEPETFQGWDPDTDEPITLTKRQVNLLSADQFKAIFRLRRADLVLPNLGPGSGRRW